MKNIAIVIICLIIGILLVAIPSAWSAIAPPVVPSGPSAAPIPAPQIDAVAEARKAAQAAGKKACDALRSYDRVKECHFVDYVPSIDIRIGEGRLAIEEICDRAVEIIADKVPEIADPWLKVRVFLSAMVPPSAACRRT